MGNESDERDHRSSQVSRIGCFRFVHSTNIICEVSCFITLPGNEGVKNDVFVNARGMCNLCGWKCTPECFCADNV